jgi:hypothetical protein
MRTTLATMFVLVALGPLAAVASGAPVPAGQQPGTATQAAVQLTAGKRSSAPCNVSIPVIGGLVSTVTNAACGAVGDVANGVGDIASDVGNSILDAVASWLIGAATSITGFVAKEMTATSTPALESSWYQAQFLPMADLGAGLALLVALVALTSAALRRSPDALAQTLTATVRAGVGTGLVVALTAIGLSLADQISGDVLRNSPTSFWNTVATAWGSGSFGGFGSSALAALIAIVEVLGALLVWLELIVRAAAIYIAVLFFPVALAASIWPPLSGWTGRLGRLLLLFVILKPITLIVLALAGNAAAAGLSLSSGLPGSVGTILAAVVIFALAAFAPWALMYLLAADAEGAWTAGAVRSGAGQAVAGQTGRSVRNGGGLASLRTTGSSGGGGGGQDGLGTSGGGSPGGGGGASSGGATRPGSPALPSGGGGGASEAPSTGSVTGGGAVGAAAGLRQPASASAGGTSGSDGGTAARPAAPATGSSPRRAARQTGQSDRSTGEQGTTTTAPTPAGRRTAPAQRRQSETRTPAARRPARVDTAMPSPVRKPPPAPRSGR